MSADMERERLRDALETKARAIALADKAEVCGMSLVDEYTFAKLYRAVMREMEARDLDPDEM